MGPAADALLLVLLRHWKPLLVPLIVQQLTDALAACPLVVLLQADAGDTTSAASSSQELSGVVKSRSEGTAATALIAAFPGAAENAFIWE
jgi:hypothetical protein